MSDIMQLIRSLSTNFVIPGPTAPDPRCTLSNLLAVSAENEDDEVSRTPTDYICIRQVARRIGNAKARHTASFCHRI